jgi:hypothetical protein
MEPYKSYVLANRSKASVSRSPTNFVSFRLLASRTFTFLVGPEKEPIDVHINLLRSLSEPLDKLMNNGSMRESTERVAVLEEVDVETFAQFAEFCYTGNYRAPPKAKLVEAVDGPNGMDAQMEEQNSPEMSLPTRYCFKCGAGWASTIPQGPMHCSNCSYSTPSIYCVLCRSCHSVARSQRERHQPVCPRCCEKAEVKRINMWKDNTVILNRLKAKKYGAMGMNHDELRAHIKNLKLEDELSEKLVCHAKLYVFATIYMVQPLKELCLHKLSRDLEAFDFGNDFAGEFTELFRYVYVNTSGNDDATIGTGSELRDLVVTYAVCKAEFLVENKAFLEALEEGGEGVLAFAVLLIKRR